MAFDPSRQLYPHWKCGEIPCTCERTLPLTDLAFTLLNCYHPGCSEGGFWTATQVSNHHLEAHEDKGYMRKLEGYRAACPGYTNGVHHER